MLRHTQGDSSAAPAASAPASKAKPKPAEPVWVAPRVRQQAATPAEAAPEATTPQEQAPEQAQEKSRVTPAGDKGAGSVEPAANGGPVEAEPVEAKGDKGDQKVGEGSAKEVVDEGRSEEHGAQATGGDGSEAGKGAQGPTEQEGKAAPVEAVQVAMPAAQENVPKPAEAQAETPAAPTTDKDALVQQFGKKKVGPEHIWPLRQVLIPCKSPFLEMHPLIQLLVRLRPHLPGLLLL